MIRVSTSVLAGAFAMVLTSTGAVGQVRGAPEWPDESRAPQAGLRERLLEHNPILVVRPMAAILGDGGHEQRILARATWPATDTTPDFALHLLAGLSLGRDGYSRSGIRIDAADHLGPVRLTGATTVSTGSGAGPRHAISITLAAGVPALRLDLRTTWLRDGRSSATRTLEPAAPTPGFPGPDHAYDGRYTDGELNARHRIGRVELRLTGGQRFGGNAHGTRTWLYGEAERLVWRRLGVQLSGGVRPARADLGQRGGRFAQLGLSMDTWATSSSAPVPVPMPDRTAEMPSVEVFEAGRYRVRLRVPGARRVELKGDITDWTIVALVRSEWADVWEITVHKPAGVYHINIRKDDGEWIVPPGLVAVPDRFGGSTGMLTLPPIKEVDDEA